MLTVEHGCELKGGQSFLRIVYFFPIQNVRCLFKLSSNWFNVKKFDGKWNWHEIQYKNVKLLPSINVRKPQKKLRFQMDLVVLHISIYWCNFQHSKRTKTMFTNTILNAIVLYLLCIEKVKNIGMAIQQIYLALMHASVSILEINICTEDTRFT